MSAGRSASMASGLPVLVTDVCGYAFHIEQAQAGVVLNSPFDQAALNKALANMQVTDALRVRGGYNRANRAPNLGELFLELQQIFTGSGGLFSDACSLRSNAPFGAGGADDDPVTGTEGPTQLASGQTMAGATSTYLICQAQMIQASTTAGIARSVRLVNSTAW